MWINSRRNIGQFRYQEMALYVCGLLHALSLYGILLTFLMLAEASECRLSHMFIEKQDFRNMQSDQGFITTFEMPPSTPILCSRVCLRNNNCASYFENTRLKVCKLFSTVLTELDITASGSEGWQYFFRTKSVCPPEKGYIFDHTALVCYKLVKESLTIEEARIFCAKDGGMLLRINNEAENNAVRNYLNRLKLKFNSPAIDGYRNGEKDVWRFSANTVLEYTSWAPEEPKKGKHCIRLLYNSQFQWAVARCDRQNYFLCSIPQI